MTKVLLIGIHGVFNYGCEAIVRGTTAILRNHDPEVQISYVTHSYDYDSKRLADLNIKIIRRPDNYKRWSLANVIYNGLERIGFKFKRPYDFFSKWADGYDAIFSVGGDIYTLHSDNSFDPALPKFIEKCLHRNPNSKYFLWGASVGPFEKNPVALNFYKHHLSLAHRIVVRENVTFDYLNSIGLTDNVVFAPDPAFFVPYNKSFARKTYVRPRIGINLSPLSVGFGYNNLQEAIIEQASTITKLVEYGYDIILVPHVHSSHPLQSDLIYMEEIKNHFPPHILPNVTLITADVGFVSLKKILSTLDTMIAVRMHCCINAISCNIPTLFLSYSAKALGMSQYIYKSDKFVIPLNSFGDFDKLISIIHEMTTPSRLPAIQSFDFKNILSEI